MASSRHLRALITNDDGIDSPGLLALAGAARDAGFDVVVAAPHRDASGVGASVQAVRDAGATRLHARELPGLPGVPAWAVEGHPAFIVHAAARGWLDPAPDVVLSGVNFGANLGHAVLHSGTVGAALTAGLHGWRALAVSLDSGSSRPEHPHWDAVESLLPGVLDVLLGADEATVLSLNVPDRPAPELRELREARLVPFGSVQPGVEQSGRADAQVLRMTAQLLARPAAPDTDVALLAAGHPTITRLVTVTDHPGVLARHEPVDRGGRLPV